MAPQPWNLGPPRMDFSALGDLGKSFFGAYDKARERQTLASLGQKLQSGDYAGAAQSAFAAGDAGVGLGILKLGEAAKERAAGTSLLQSWGLGGGGAAAPSASLGTPNEIEDRFVSTVKGAGLTNPIGLAAVAATGKSESGFSPQNVNRSWSDPSESGQPGTAGGIMSWRAERLQNLQNFARQRGEAQPSVETQALFLAQENPQLIPALQAAKTPQEANQIMANAWRFAGYNRPGGENARRLALTQAYSQRYGGGAAPAGQPTPAVAAGNRPVLVAETEEDVRHLEAQMPGYGGGTAVASVPGDDPVKLRQEAEFYRQSNPEAARQFLARAQAAEQGRGAQFAQAGTPPGEMRPPDGAPAQGFFIPPGQSGTPANVQPTQSAPPSVEDDEKVKLWQNRYSQSAALGNERAMKIAEKNLEMATKAAERRLAQNAPTDVQRNYEAARRQGYQGTLLDYQRELRQSTTVNVDQKGEGEYAKTIGKSLGERMDAISKEGDTARSDSVMIGQLRQLGGQIKNIGGGAALQGWLAERGIKVGPNVSEIEAFNALVDKMTPQQRVPGSGASSDLDVKMFKSALPNLIRTPGGNAIILDTLDAIAQDKAARAAIADRALTGELKPQDAIKELRALPDPMAAFKEARKAGFKNMPEPAPAPPPVPVQAPASPTQQRPVTSGPVTATHPQTGKKLMLSPSGAWEPFDG